MSGIAVLFHRQAQPVEPGDIWPMMDAIPYRGPDGVQVTTAGAVGLGVAKMAITPEEVDETQPLTSPRTGAMIAADARIDNRADLIAALPDPVPVTISDAALILHAFDVWGTAFVDHLLGDSGTRRNNALFAHEIRAGNAHSTTVLTTRSSPPHPRSTSSFRIHQCRLSRMKTGSASR
jgi:hypothetical protein